MKISRYIYIPFKIGILYAFLYLLFGKLTGSFAGDFVVGSIFGLVMLFYNDYRVRKVASKDDEGAYQVRPKRKIILFTNYEKSFEWCKESISVIRKGKLKEANYEQGIIKAKLGINWHNLGNKITYKLTKLTEVTTEVEISSVPIMRTAMVDYGVGWKTLKDIDDFLNEKNLEMNRKYLEKNKTIPADTHFDSKLNKEEIFVK